MPSRPDIRTDLLDELSWRGLLYQQTDGLGAHLAKGAVTGYCGFDPTASSLHVGNLVPVMGLVHLARAGHKPVALVGGGTAMIGDPSGKSTERVLMGVEEIDANASAIHAQIEGVCQRALGGAGASPGQLVEMKNNASWLREIGMLEFMRDVGKHFSINYMMAKDSVQSRLDSGISFTEFSYMLCQAYDFLAMFKSDGVTLQIGGSDQWGNITAGTELVRRSAGGEAYGLTLPLVTTASGTKFGKTESGAVWLDAARTSPYQFYQFWINTEDADVGKYLRMFTLLTRTEIESLEAAHAVAPHERAAQKALAAAVTTLIHGAEAARTAEQVSKIIFDKRTDPNTIGDEVFTMLASEIPSAKFGGEDFQVLELLETAFGLSRGAGKKLLQQGGVVVNGEKLGADTFSVPRARAVRGRWFLIRKGKQDIALADLG
jgi:tyrosyl-tRNA synthetase